MERQASTLEVTGVRWSRREGARNDTHRSMVDDIEAIDVACSICHSAFRAERTRSPGQFGFHAFLYVVTIACHCGALGSFRIDDLLQPGHPKS